jgi:hypothetical protein
LAIASPLAWLINNRAKILVDDSGHPDLVPDLPQCSPLLAERCTSACNSSLLAFDKTYHLTLSNHRLGHTAVRIYCFSHVTCVFQSTNAPWGLSRHAQTCSSNKPGKP